MINIKNLMDDVYLKCGKNYSEMSRKLGISRQAVYDLIDGTNLPSEETAEKIAKILEIDEELLFVSIREQKAKGHAAKVWQNILAKLEGSAAGSTLLLGAVTALTAIPEHIHYIMLNHRNGTETTA